MEFIYNGQNYQHTKYTQWTTTSSNTKKTSNATETESARDNLNKGLAEIGPNTGVSYSINTENHHIFLNMQYQLILVDMEIQKI